MRSWAPLLTIAVLLAAACGPKRVAQVPRPSQTTLIALLPDPETGTTGRARVVNEFGAVDLAAPCAATRASATSAPEAVKTLSDADVKAMFRDVMATLPPAPQHFTLHFRFESDTLTAESNALVPEILKAVKGLKVPEVVVVGHTDTLGDSKVNLALGLKRATTVSGILIKAGLAASTIEITSHGEGDLLVKTPDNTPEPRNRRVEITVR